MITGLHNVICLLLQVEADCVCCKNQLHAVCGEARAQRLVSPVNRGSSHLDTMLDAAKLHVEVSTGDQCIQLRT